jgi:adenylate kinase
MLNIAVFGAPGSGKGTQSELIIKKYGLQHISTGEILRKEIERQTELGLVAEGYINQGQLVPDELVIDMFADLLDNSPPCKGYVFDGFPRTLSQAKALDQILTERNTSVAAVLNLSVEEEELIQRLLKRGEYAGRSDDNLETIKNRLIVYQERTEPLKEYYKKKGKLFKIKGVGSIEDVFENIMEAIDRLIK